MSWTPERVETLKRLWAEGQTAAVIARQLGGCTRNAVCGKVDRLGLAQRHTQFNTEQAIRRVRARAKVKAAAPTPLFASVPLPPEPPMPAAPGVRLSILQLTNATCKCGLGDPKDADFGFCGQPSLPGSPYCAQHKRLMYRNEPVKRRRPKSNLPQFQDVVELAEAMLRAA